MTRRCQQNVERKKLAIKNYTQADLGDTLGLFPDHHNPASPNLFAGGGASLQFVRNETSVKHL